MKKLLSGKFMDENGKIHDTDKKPTQPNLPLQDSKPEKPAQESVRNPEFNPVR